MTAEAPVKLYDCRDAFADTLVELARADRRVVAGGTTRPGGNPSIAGPGERPSPPLSTEGPVLVTAEAPSTA